MSSTCPQKLTRVSSQKPVYAYITIDRMVYPKRVVCNLSALGRTVEELAEKYNRISIHLKGSKLHRKKGLKDEIVYIVAHNM